MKNFIFNKYYRHLRSDIFNSLDISDFVEVYSKFRRLSLQYRLLQICNFIEKFNIPNVQIPLFGFFIRLLDFLRWKIYDLLLLLINGRKFNLFGVTIFCGRQGSGKTMSMVEYLERIKQQFPNCLVVTNFNYIRQDMPLVDWRQLLETRNGEDGVIFAIDEIQNEYDNSKWKDFPERYFISNYPAT
ncbi:MAG: hypothetical protein ACLU8F_02970 [Clostridia bacterium]